MDASCSHGLARLAGSLDRKIRADWVSGTEKENDAGQKLLNQNGL